MDIIMSYRAVPFLSSFTTSPATTLSSLVATTELTSLSSPAHCLTEGHTPQVSTTRPTLPNWTCYGDHKLRPFLRHFFYAAEDDEPIH